MRAQRILVIARGHLGDLVGALPALRDLRRAYPASHITAFVNEYVRDALDGCPFVDEVIYGFTYTPRGRAGRLMQKLSVLRRTFGRYDVVIGLRRSPPMASGIALLSGARARVGFDKSGIYGRLLTHNVGRESLDISNRILNQIPLQALGIDVDPSLPKIDWLSPAVREEVARLLETAGLRRDAAFAVFQVSSHWGCYEWGSDKWAALADYLVDEYGLQIVATGTSEAFERAKFDDIQRRSKHPLISLLGRTSIPQLFDVVDRATLVVGCDSALTQIALAQRTPSVIIFGIEPIEQNGPLPCEVGTLIEPIQHWEGPGLAPTPNPHCRFGESYCHTAYCAENSSLRQTSADEVKARADRILASSPMRATAAF